MERRLRFTHQEEIAYAEERRNQLDDLKEVAQAALDEAGRMLKEAQASAVDAIAAATLVGAIVSLLGLIAAAGGS